MSGSVGRQRKVLNEIPGVIIITDVYSKEKRSEIMSKIGGKDTKSETLVRKFLFSNGFRYRKNDKRQPGTPDIVLSKYKTVVFVHGCFWHGHKGCKASTLPGTRKEFWENKISKNIERDSRNKSALMERDWKVLTIWGCEIKTEKKREKRLERLIKEIRTI